MQNKKELNIHIGNNIRMIRERLGLTQEEFAEKISLATKTISKIECGIVGISLSALKRICETFHVSGDEILFGNKNTKDHAYLAKRLEQLTPEQLDIVSKFLFSVFEV